MSTAVLILFVTELAAACAELGIETPRVVPVARGEQPAFLTWVIPAPPGFEPEVRVSDRLRGSDRFVRCVARHEAAHLYLGHSDPEGRGGAWEAEADALLRDRWGERPRCW